VRSGKKSGIDNAIVPQNATADVSPAPKTLPAAGRPDGPTAGGFANMGPSPPARAQAQMNKAAPTASRKGEPHVSRNLIESMPRRTIQTFIPQNSKKLRKLAVLRPMNAGRICGSVAMPGQIASTSL